MTDQPIGFASFVGQIPDVAQTNYRTHCERCGGALASDKAHICAGNAFWHTKEHEGGPELEIRPMGESVHTTYFTPAGEVINCEPLKMASEAETAALEKFLIDANKEAMTPVIVCPSCGQKFAESAGHDVEACTLSNAPAQIVTPPPMANVPVQIVAAPPMTEQAKYEAMWAHAQYREIAPGESLAALFLAQPQGPKPGDEVIDFGAGTGRGALMLALLGQCRVHMVDFAANALDDDLREMLTTQAQSLQFTQHDLTAPLPFTAEYGFCTDVLEHIPPEQINAVLKNILGAARHVFFQISCGDDVCGKLIGEPLHLSVHDYDWWRAKFTQLECIIHWSENRGGVCLFYVTAWSSGADFQKAGVLNIEEEQVRKNVRANCLGMWQQVSPHRANDNELILLCGGPSLDSQLETIKELRAENPKTGTVTMNGAYHWAIEHGVFPGCQIMCDARPFNKRFVEPVIDNCKYLIASQCDPEVFKALPPDRTFMWHTTADAIRDILQELLPQWWGVPGGCTVLLRAIPMLRMLGYQKFHVFGADSCLLDDKHHAYAQPENDDQLIIPTIIGGRTFQCHPWMIAQAQEWMELIRILGETFQVEVYGDGLLAWIMEHAADEDLKDEVRKADVAIIAVPGG